MEFEETEVVDLEDRACTSSSNDKVAHDSCKLCIWSFYKFYKKDGLCLYRFGICRSRQPHLLQELGHEDLSSSDEMGSRSSEEYSDESSDEDQEQAYSNSRILSHRQGSIHSHRCKVLEGMVSGIGV